jgi:hypothetical protein
LGGTIAISLRSYFCGDIAAVIAALLRVIACAYQNAVRFPFGKKSVVARNSLMSASRAAATVHQINSCATEHTNVILV